MSILANVPDWVRFILVLAFFALLYVIYSTIHFNQVKKQVMAMQESLRKGDLVKTQSGLYGTLQTIGKNVVQLKLADGLVIAIDRFSIKEKVDPEAVKADLEAAKKEQKK